MIIGWVGTWGLALAFALMPSISLEGASLLFLGITVRPPPISPNLPQSPPASPLTFDACSARRPQVCYLLADCAADAALVGLSIHEPVESRGSILSTAYCIRFLSSTLSAAVIAFLYNGPPTCGDFDIGLSTQQLMWIVVVRPAQARSPP